MRDILRLALAESRIVVTLDSDFHAILALSPAPSPSVIRIRIQGLRAEALVPMLLNAIGQFETELREGAAMSIQERKLRVRRLPLGR